MPQGNAGEGKYNPGGFEPEVAEAASWSVFILLLVGLLLLLLVPTAIALIARFFCGRREDKVKIKNTSKSKQGRVELKS